MISVCGCNKTDTPQPTTSTSDPVASALEAWAASAIPADADNPIADMARKALAQARAQRLPGLYCVAAQFSSEDIKSTKAILDEAITLFPDMDGPHLMMSELYFHLAFFDLLRRDEISIAAVPTGDVKPSDIKDGYVGDDIGALVASGKSKLYAAPLTKAGFDEKSMLQVQAYMLSFSEMMPEVRQMFPEIIEKVGRPTFLPVVKWSPAVRSTPLLQLAQSEMRAARNAKRMPELNPNMRIINRATYDRLSKRLDALVGEAKTSNQQAEDATSRWKRVLENPPPIPDSTVSPIRIRHHAKLSTLNESDLLRGAYDLGCAMSAWRLQWVAYQMLTQAGSVDQGVAASTKSRGAQIITYLELLGIDLTDQEHRYMRLQYSGADALGSLCSSIEKQLESKHGHSHHQIYSLAYAQSGAVTIIRNSEVDNTKWQQLAMVDVSTLNALARDLDVAAALRERAAQLKQQRPGPQLAADVLQVADELFGAICASIEKKQ